VPKSGHVTITKKKENLHKDTRKKFTDSKNAILFDLAKTKNNEVIAENPF